MFCEKCAHYERRDGIHRWWVRWYTSTEMGPFNLFTPWWISGSTMHEPPKFTLVALIKAKDEDEVKEIVFGAYDKRPADIEFSFIEQVEPTWQPNDRFPFDEWMSKYWARPRYKNEE